MSKTYVMYEPTHASSFIDAKEKGILIATVVRDAIPAEVVKHIALAANEYLIVGIVQTHYKEI